MIQCQENKTKKEYLKLPERSAQLFTNTNYQNNSRPHSRNPKSQAYELIYFNP